MPFIKKAKKRFGQNFLQDSDIITQLIEFIQPEPSQNLVEIGPGRGALSQALLAQGCKPYLIEIDRDLIAYLQQHLPKLMQAKLYQADALQFNFAQLGNKLRILGNLPYNISTPLLFYLMRFSRQITDMHFMLQQEVANRIAAQANSKQYGRLSVMLQYHCQVQTLLSVPAHAFSPTPKVQSVFIRLVPYQTLPAVARDYHRFSQIVTSAFNQRRKTLANSLKAYFSRQQLLKNNIDPTARAENLSVNDFVCLSEI